MIGNIGRNASMRLSMRLWASSRRWFRSCRWAAFAVTAAWRFQPFRTLRFARRSGRFSVSQSLCRLFRRLALRIDLHGTDALRVFDLAPGGVFMSRLWGPGSRALPQRTCAQPELEPE